VVALDLPNFGDTQTSESVISVDEYGKFLANFADKLKLKDYTLVGHSMGGQISIRAIANGSLSPNKLILIGSAGIRDNRKTYKAFLKVSSRVLKHLVPRGV